MTNRLAPSRASWLFIMSASLAACAGGDAQPSQSAEQDTSTGGEHAHGGGHHHGGRCHGRGEHGDFSDAECFSQMFDAPERDAWQRPDEVIGLLQLTHGMVVADLGAGTGYFESRLAAAVGPEGRVLALDVAPEMVEWMTQRFAREGLTQVEARQVSPTSAALAPTSVDRILVVDTWHHIEERVAYARELAAALRPGGDLVIVDFTMESPQGPPAAMRLSAQSVVEELTSAGLSAEVVSEELPHQWVVRASRPL